MSRRKIDGFCGICTIATRASNCSDRLRTNRGQRSAPGMISYRFDIIWQPLHTPSAKLSLRVKNALNSSRAGIEEDGLGPALAGAEHVAELKPPQAAKPSKSFSDARPSIMSLMVTSTAAKPARSKAAAISIWPFTPCSRRMAMRGLAPLPM